MTIPDGYQCDAYEALKFKKAIYGLVQAASQFFKQICDALLKANSKQTKLTHSWYTKMIKIQEYVSC